MTKTLNIAALTAITLVAAASIAEAASEPSKNSTGANRGSVQREGSLQPSKHQGSVKPQGTPTSSGSGKVVTGQNNKPPVVVGQTKPPVVHCDPGPCKGNKPPIVVHCDPLPCKGTKPGKDHPIKVVEDHKPHHWHHHHHHHHKPEYRYVTGYNTYAYRPQPSHATAPAAPVPASCLTKEYLTNGPVLFKDTCSKEWAMGDAAASRFVNVGCLRKEYVEGRKVKFSDVCTKEWAMNPPAGQQTTAASTESEKDDD